MRKLNWLIASVAIILFVEGSPQAAETCEQQTFGFIYEKSFDIGDGEGMGTHACNETNFRHGDAAYKKMKSLADAGKYPQAEAVIGKGELARADGDNPNWKPDDADCVRPSMEKPFLALMMQIGQGRSDALEKRGDLLQAIRTHDAYCQFSESARIYTLRVKSAPFDRFGYSHEQEFQDAYAYSKVHPFDSFIKELREIAAARAAKFRKLENELFQPTLYAPVNLEYALEWLPYAGDDGSQKKTIMTLAGQRGDMLASHEGCNDLGPTIEYYKIAGNQTKARQATAKAMRLSESFEKQGAYPAAAKCYAAAGAQDKAAHAEDMANAKREQNAATYEKNEQSRKEKFSKDQDDLEKELGF
jgi:hypothetical protein